MGEPSTCPRGLVPAGESCGLPTCVAGRVRADDGLHCCWPGQRWRHEACGGAPRCPDTHEAVGEECVLTACLPGLVRAEDGLHCCWPGQRWGGETCTGVPECPAGHVADGGSCVVAACERGRIRVADGVHCCWPGQGWDALTGCTGEPRCEAGYEAGPSGCVLARCIDGRVRADDGVHCCWAGQTFIDGRCRGTPTCPAERVGREEDCAVRPATGHLLLHLEPGATVTLGDGRNVPLGAPFELPAGTFELLARAPGRRPQRVAIEILPGRTTERAIPLVIVEEPTDLSGWAVGSGLLGLALTGGGIGLQVAADGLRSDVRSAANEGVVAPERLTMRDAKRKEGDANTLATLAFASWVAGGVLVATSIVLFVSDPDKAPEVDAHVLGFAPLDRGALLTIEGAF